MPSLHTILRDPERKQSFVTPMFDRIAPRYDEFTRKFSLGMDRGWKRTVLEWYGAQRPVPQQAVDVACGTGDLAFGCAAAGTARVLGLDASGEMVRRARARQDAESVPGVEFAETDLCRTGLADGWADAVTAGYAFRNVPTIDGALSEMARIVRPGGYLYSLDFYRPEPRLWRTAWLSYLRMTGGVVGWLWHRSPVTYSYIAHSIDAWVSVAEYERALRRHGFHVVQQRTVLWSAVAMHAAIRR